MPSISNNPQEPPWYIQVETISPQLEIRFSQHLHAGTGSIIADGSYKLGRSSAAVVIQHEHMNQCPDDPTHVISTTVPGHPKDQSSYRGELGGILLGIVFTNRIAKKYNITKGICTFGSDNKGALAASFGWKSPTPDWSCFDIVALIRYHLKHSPIEWKHVHVRGHQDDTMKFADLTPKAQANVIADQEAKKELRAFNTPHETWCTTHSHGQSWAISCNGERINGVLEERLRELTQEREALNWWFTKLSIPPSNFQDIDTVVYKKFRKDTPRKYRIWSIKMAADLLPTMNNMYKRRQSPSHVCPCCGSANESSYHLFQCREIEMKKTFNESIDGVSTYLSTTTSAEIRQGILTLLEHLRINRTPPAHPPSEVTTAVAKQFIIGIRATLNGMWCAEWIEVQQLFNRRSRSRCCPRLWLVNLTLHLQRAMYNLWNTRNDAVHKKQDSAINTREHRETDAKINDLFSSLPNLRLLPQSDAAFFARGKQRIQSYRLQRKKKWVSDATAILESFRRSLDANSTTFLEYFTNT